MARRKTTDPFRMPTPKEEMSMAMEHLVEKAVLCHPQTQKLRAQIAKEMQKAAKVPQTPTAGTRKAKKS